MSLPHSCSTELAEEVRQTARTLTCLPQVCSLLQDNCGDPHLFTTRQCHRSSAHTRWSSLCCQKQAAVKPKSLVAHPLQPQSSSQAAYAATDNNNRILELCEHTIER